MDYQLGDQVIFWWANGHRHRGRIVGRTIGECATPNCDICMENEDFKIQVGVPVDLIELYDPDL